MELVKLKTNADFINAVIPQGSVLVFYTIDNGKIVKRCKDSAGTYTDISRQDDKRS